MWSDNLDAIENVASMNATRKGNDRDAGSLFYPGSGGAKTPSRLPRASAFVTWTHRAILLPCPGSTLDPTMAAAVLGG